VCRTACLVTDGVRGELLGALQPRPDWGYAIHPMETRLGAVLIVCLRMSVLVQSRSAAYRSVECKSLHHCWAARQKAYDSCWA